jgi:hypothetical protein
MARPEMQKPGWEGGRDVSRPLYLRRVAFEHRRLITGDVERPGPELAAAIEAALQLHGRMRREREAALSDPWWEALS